MVGTVAQPVFGLPDRADYRPQGPFQGLVLWWRLSAVGQERKVKLARTLRGSATAGLRLVATARTNQGQKRAARRYPAVDSKEWPVRGRLGWKAWAAPAIAG